MKKKSFAFFLFAFVAPALLFAQSTDTVTIVEEMQKIKQLSDSLAKAQTDSLAGNTGSITPADIPEEDSATTNTLTLIDKALDIQKKERRIFRNNVLLATAGFLLLLASMRIVLNKQEQRKKRKQQRSPSN